MSIRLRRARESIVSAQITVPQMLAGLI